MANAGPLDGYRFRTEKPEHKAEQIVVRLDEGGDLHLSVRPNRPSEDARRCFFERDWPAWLAGAIYDTSPRG